MGRQWNKHLVSYRPIISSGSDASEYGIPLGMGRYLPLRTRGYRKSELYTRFVFVFVACLSYLITRRKSLKTTYITVNL